MAYKDVTPPVGGKISIQGGKLNVPDNPILPFIRGDGTGPDIWRASERVFDAAVQKAYGGKRKVAWFEVFAGETAKPLTRRERLRRRLREIRRRFADAWRVLRHGAELEDPYA